MVNLEHVNKKIGKKNILEDIHCQLDHGVYGVLGPNGAGKTTLMRCMMGLYKITSGKISMDGKPIQKTKRKKIGYLPQKFGVFQGLSLRDSMRYFASLKGIDSQKISVEIQRCLKAVYLLDKEKMAGEKLSGGMVRRAGVAQAMLGSPELILFDEPTAGLDPKERMHFKNIVSNLGETETVIVSTHIVEDIESCCDYVIIMNGGKICKIGTCEEITEYATGKVYEFRKEELDSLTGNFILQKQYESKGNICYRVLVSECAGKVALNPTLEDGYMCAVKGI